MDIQKIITQLLQSFYPGFNAPAAQPAKAYNDPSQIQIRYTTPMISGGGAPQSTPQPTQTPSAPPMQMPQQQTQQNPSGGFHYLMGQSDYSQLRPQIDAVLKNTPLSQYANDFIQAGNTHHVDPRVLLTIANNESSLGRNYPTDSYNPFGYNATGAGMIKGPDGRQYVNVDQGLRDAGFTSIPMAIDRLSGRFERQPTEGYKHFYQDPTISNLQQAYNATPSERDNYIKNAQALLKYFQQGN